MTTEWKYTRKPVDLIPAGSRLYSEFLIEEIPFSPHWAIKHAMENPNQLFEAQRTEGPWTYTCQYMYISKAKKFQVYNAGLGIRCPYWCSHHLGSTCKVCDQKD